MASVSMIQVAVVAVCLLGMFVTPAESHVNHLRSTAGAMTPIEDAPWPHPRNVHEHRAYDEPHGTEASDYKTEKTTDPDDVTQPGNTNVCVGLLVALVVLACCGLAFTLCSGRWAIILVVVWQVAVLVYLFATGTYKQWWEGGEMGIWCKLLCIMVLIQMISTIWCCCCTTCTGLFVGLAVKYEMKKVRNQAVQMIQQEFEELQETLSPDKKEYYKSKEFKAKCDKVFDETDLDKNGTLSMAELKDTVLKDIGNDDVLSGCELIVNAFEKQGHTEIDRDEFVEMMKFFDLIGDIPEFMEKFIEKMKSKMTPEQRAFADQAEAAVKDKGGEAKERAARALKEKDGTENLKKDAAKEADNLKEQAQEAEKKAEKQVREKAEELKKVAEKEAAELKKKVEEAAEEAKKQAKEMAAAAEKEARAMKEKLEKEAQELKTKMDEQAAIASEKAEELKETVSKEAQELKTKMDEQAAIASEKAQELKKQMDEQAALASAKADELKAKLQEADVAEKAAEMKKQAEELAAKLAEKAAEAEKQVEAKAQDAEEGFTESAGSKKSKKKKAKGEDGRTPPEGSPAMQPKGSPRRT